MTEAGWTMCGDCGMPCEPGEYHPYAACLMFKQCRDSKTVRANLQAVRDDSYQQGRVAGYQEGLSEAIRVANEDGNILAVRQVLNWMAQQAQDEQSMKGEQ